METKGTHIILNGYNVAIDFSELDIITLTTNIKQGIIDSGMTILGENFYDFKEPIGAFTYMILLGESHFSMHTFPEERKVTCDIYSCNISKDFSKELETIIHMIIEVLHIQSPQVHVLKR